MVGIIVVIIASVVVTGWIGFQIVDRACCCDNDAATAGIAFTSTICVLGYDNGLWQDESKDCKCQITKLQA